MTEATEKAAQEMRDPEEVFGEVKVGDSIVVQIDEDLFNEVVVSRISCDRGFIQCNGRASYMRILMPSRYWKCMIHDSKLLGARIGHLEEEESQPE